jgi:hypothetical protein
MKPSTNAAMNAAGCLPPLMQIAGELVAGSFLSSKMENSLLITRFLLCMM